MDAVEKRLAALLAQNPTRTNFQARYEEIVADYNKEKDRVAIETTFASLIRFIEGLSEEESGLCARDSIRNLSFSSIF